MSRERRESQVVDFMIHDLEEFKANQDLQEIQVSQGPKESLSSALLDLRGHLGHQELVMMGVKDLQDHQAPQDLQGPPYYLEHTDPTTLSVFLDLLVLLVHLEVQVNPLG